jgi:hypothetical protein
MSHSKSAKRSKIMNFFNKSVELSASISDPMNIDVLPDEIRELILSFLPVKELLNSCLVSKLWLEIITHSLAFKKQVAIKLHSWHQEPPVEIKNSTREYEIIQISDFKLSSKTQSCLKNKNWKNLTLNVAKIREQKDFVKLMEVFKTVKDLKIMSVNIRELNRDVQKLQLSAMETLVLSDITLDLFDIFIAHQPSLKNLSLRHVITDISSPKRVGEVIVEFLQLNEQVKDLELNFVVTNDLFTVDISNLLKNKLKSFTIGLNETSTEVRGHIEEFLRFQGDALEHLKLVLHQKSVRRGPNEWNYWHHRRAAGNDEDSQPSEDISIIFNAWNSMNTLKSLAIRFLQNSEEIEENRELMKSLKRNVNITSLFVQFMNVSVPASIFLNLLKLSPNLSTLYVTRLTPDIIRFAAINLRNLRKLMCFSFEGECQQEYNEIKASRNDVNTFIVISDRCAYG